MTPDPAAKTKRLNASAKGRKLVQLAKAILEAQGCRVEVAANQVRWIPRKTGPGMTPISVHHDFFEVWDLLAVFPKRRRRLVRAFFQVTTLPEASRRREKIIASDFPVMPEDAILAWVGGRGRHFRVLRGPAFETESTERWDPIKPRPPSSAGDELEKTPAPRWGE